MSCLLQRGEAPDGSFPGVNYRLPGSLKDAVGEIILFLSALPDSGEEPDEETMEAVVPPSIAWLPSMCRQVLQTTAGSFSLPAHVKHRSTLTTAGSPHRRLVASPVAGRAPTGRYKFT